MLCASCGSPLPAGARFCSQCGASTLTGGATAAPVGEAAVAEPVARHERRVLTVLFGDLVGFTSISDGADPEDVRARVRPFHDLVRREVARGGGTVARVVGDGVMVVWGYPVAREDDAARAIRTAIAIGDGLARSGLDLHARFGINTGEAVVAFGSNDERADDAMGDAVNVASRLAAAAPIDGVVIGEATARLAGSALEADPLPPLTLKGKAEPVPALLVRRMADTAVTAPPAPFVGRRSELETIAAAFSDADSGHRAVTVLISGEPGIGKSRLLAEARAALPEDRLAGWLVGRCRPDAGAPAWAFGELVRAWAEIADDATPAAALARIETRLPGDVAERAWVRDRLGQLVGVVAGAAPSTEELARVLGAFLGAVADSRTIVVEIEDVHWADPELVDLLAGSTLRSMATSALIVATARPEALATHPTLAAIDGPRIHLAPLGSVDGEELVTRLAGGLDLDPTARTEILARSGGNPLFAGELVRLIAQDRAGRATASTDRQLLPDTVQAVIAARLDLLDAETRALARDAAVVGASFWRGALQALGALHPERAGTGEDAIDTGLTELVRLEFVAASPDSNLPGDAEYAFRHALVRDVAYGQLTRPDRAARHAAAGRWLADAAGPDRDDLASIVADHDLRALELSSQSGLPVDAGLAEHAFRSLMRAGRHAAALDARAAIERYRAAGRVAPDEATRLDAFRRLATVLIDGGDYSDAFATIDAGLRLAEALLTPEAEGALYLTRARARRTQGDSDWAADITLAIRLLESIPPTMTLAEACAYQTLVEMTQGSGAALIRWADRAIEIAGTLGQAPPPSALARRGFTRAMLGDADGAHDLERAVELARAGGDSIGLANAVSDLGGAYACRGDMPRVEACVRESIAIARARGLPGAEALGRENLGHFLRVQGRFEEAFAALDGAREISVAIGDRVRPFTVERDRALAFESMGEYEASDAAGLSLREAIPGPDWDGVVATVDVLSAGRRGDEAGVRDAFAGVFLQDGEGDVDIGDAISYLPVARAAISVGARDIVARILTTVATNSAFGAALHDTLEGLVLSAEAQLAAAEAPLVRGIVFWDMAGYGPEAAHARSVLADCLAGIPARRNEAVGLLREAIAAWTRCGAPVRVAEGEAALARLESRVRAAS